MTEDDVPVLTEVVSDALDSREALAREIERAVLERLAPEFERVLAELKINVTTIVREAVAEALATTPKPE